MGMYGAGMGKCNSCEHPIENHCADDHWCSKCEEESTDHDIKLDSKYDGVKLIDG